MSEREEREAHDMKKCVWRTLSDPPICLNGVAIIFCITHEEQYHAYRLNTFIKRLWEPSDRRADAVNGNFVTKSE